MSVLLSLGKTILAPILKHLPGFAMRRIYTEQKLNSGVEVDLRSIGGVVVMNLGGIPTIEIALRATNHLPFDVVIDRCNIEVWFGQPTLKISLDAPLTISANSTRSDLRFRAHLSEAEFSSVKSALDTADLGSALYIYVLARCEAGFAKFEKAVTIERRGHDLASIPRYRTIQPYIDPAIVKA